MSKLAYLGPVDPDDPSSVYRLPGDPDVVLRLGVETEVTTAQRKALEADEAHRFGKAADAGPGEPFAGYDDRNADDVVKALGDPNLVPTAAAAQAVIDYESAHGARKTVLEAATHQLEAFAPGGGDSDDNR